MYVIVCNCMYVCMYVCMHACMHVCVYVCNKKLEDDAAITFAGNGLLHWLWPSFLIACHSPTKNVQWY
jgi:hypothetical protein